MNSREEVKRAMAIDPICGMKVDEKEAAATYEYKGKTYYFCASLCMEKFSQSPEKFIKQDKGQTSGERRTL